MDEYECWVLRAEDGSIVSKHLVLAAELGGEGFELSSPELPDSIEAGVVMGHREGR